MSRHFWRACDRTAGVTMVELLVTIIIAGIAFAALVPMFVQAQGKNSADQARNQALNVAQDRIEKIRALSYSEITEANLNSSAFFGGQFGTSATLEGLTQDRIIHVSYTVTVNPSGASAMTSQYKTVVVRTWWTAPPKPVKQVVVQTVIYRQFAGPTIGSMWTDPIMQQSGVLGGSGLNVVKFNATPDIGWQGGSTESVHFQLWDNGGTLVTDATVDWGTNLIDRGVNVETFWWNWDSTFALDGTYKISATATNGTFEGPPAEFYFIIDRGGAPGAPPGLTSVASSKQIDLTWNTPLGGPITGYEVFRADDVAGAPGTWTSLGEVTAASCSDTGLPDNTKFWYTVRAKNAAAGWGPKASPVSATTAQNTGDTTKPTQPTNLVATGDSPSAGNIRLTWTPSTDVGSGMLDYQIYRSSSAGGPFTLLVTQLAGNPTVYSDNIGSSSIAQTFYYYVVARDVALNPSIASSTVSATVAAVTNVYTLTLQNTQNGNRTRYAWVQRVLPTPAMYYPQSGLPQSNPFAGVAVAAKNGTQSWTNLPPGKYNVWVSTSLTFPSNPQSTPTITSSNVTQTIN
jgi:type II secretory pathway pseudopilin PulG